MQVCVFFYHFLLFKCVTFPHEHSFIADCFRIDLKNDTLHFKSSKHVTNIIVQLPKKMKIKQTKTSKQKTIQKSFRSRLWDFSPGISTEIK